jgi:hypothetical protein
LGAVRFENVFPLPFVVPIHIGKVGMTFEMPHCIRDNEKQGEKKVGDADFQDFDDVLHKIGLGD